MIDQTQTTDEQIEQAVEKSGVSGAANQLACSRITVIRRMNEIDAQRQRGIDPIAVNG